jgi:hypothetical protein
LQTDVLRVEESTQACVVGGSNVQSDIVVELADRDFVKLLADKTEVAEVGRPRYLC